ncbi:MAG: PD40 domain-containing protein [Theionarchaea archaeon]|nr:PD40 domain-containing protein [Theionarchaea archaeon]MBU7000351.1 PD40 domain-containing protein [Theionarchaea archaeon]MBU7020634.1 PD40 domain-containing protein [Theionarchaea archaeon]MBU7035203.1 PD40 domain-containing protein [Theionarchaea archaeon]MBU7040427.1 PD40 domain-containing protein [Theionarchaea archaeon]
MKKVMIVVIVVIFCSGCAGQSQKRNDSSSTAANVTTIVEYGKSLDWCPANNRIVFGKMGDDSYYDVHIMNPDGSQEKCLTGKECPQKHNGNPVWHPSGEYIVFTSENEDVEGHEYDRVSIPGRGINCNLWAVTSDGETFWQLTEYPTSFANPKGVIHPQFSHDGSMLLWAERIERKDGTPWGEWALKVADFIVDDDLCHLENIRAYQPGASLRFYESHAFSGDDTKILFSGNLLSTQLESGLDIYELDLKTEDLTRLTDTFDDWDEHAHYSPNGEKIAWMSSTDLGDLGITFDDMRNHVWGLKLKTELWIMDANGSHKQRLTWFNEPGNDEYMGHVIVSDSTWSPDGEKMAACIAYEDGRDTQNFRSRIILIDLGTQKKDFSGTLHFEQFLDMKLLISAAVLGFVIHKGSNVISPAIRWIYRTEKDRSLLLYKPVSPVARKA